MFFSKKNKPQENESVTFDKDVFINSLVNTGIEQDKAKEIAHDVLESIETKVTEKTVLSYDNFVSSITSNVEGLSVLPTERVQACKELNAFLSENPEVNNSIRLYASYIAYGSAETKLEEYKVTVLGTDKEEVDKAQKIIKKWERQSKIRRTIYPLAKDLIPFGDAFLEKIYYTDSKGETKLAGVSHIPTHTIYPKLDKKGFALKYYQIIDSNSAKFADNGELQNTIPLQDGSIIEFNRNEIIHFSDGSAIGVTDTPYYNLIILWRYLKMLEESLVIHRMTRARRFIVFFLDVTGKTKIEIRTAISNFTRTIKSIFNFNLKKGSVVRDKSTVPSSSDLVIPVTKDSATKVQNIPSDPSDSKTDDLTFYLNRITTNMFTSHVFKNSQQTGNEKYIEKSFMRLVKIYQRQMEYVLEDLYNELLVEKGFSNLEVKINFPSPDSEQEIRIVDSIVRRMMIINQLTATIGVTPPTEWIVKYVFKDLSQFEIEELVNMLQQAIETQQQDKEEDDFPSIFDEDSDNASEDKSLRNQGENIFESDVSDNLNSLLNNITKNKLERVQEKTNKSNNVNESLKIAIEYMNMYHKK